MHFITSIALCNLLWSVKQDCIKQTVSSTEISLNNRFISRLFYPGIMNISNWNMDPNQLAQRNADVFLWLSQLQTSQFKPSLCHLKSSLMSFWISTPSVASTVILCLKKDWITWRISKLTVIFRQCAGVKKRNALTEYWKM